MSQSIQVNGQTINYPETGDTNWSDDATNFAIQTSAALGKIGLSSGTSVDITQTLDVTGNTTLDANLSVGGNASVTGNTTLTGDLTVNGNTQLGNANTDTIGVTGIVNVDSGVLYVDPVNNRVGINDTTPSVALDVTGDISATGNLSVNGNTTLGDASGDSLTINSNGVSIPNGLNFDSNTLVIDSTNNRVGVGTNTPGSRLDILGSNGITNFTGTSRLGLVVRGSTSTNDYSGIDFIGASGSHPLGRIALLSTGGGSELSFGTSNSYSAGITNESFKISFNGQLSAIVPGGSTLYPGFLCRAWVNFDGTAVVSPASATGIRASGNITSILDNGTGDYTINFTTNMPDADYSAQCTAGDSNTYVASGTGDTKLISKTNSSLRINTGSQSGSSRVAADYTLVDVAIFR